MLHDFFFLKFCVDRFTSTTTRFKPQQTAAKMPGPAAYRPQIAKDINYTNPFRVAKRDGVSFGSSQDRMKNAGAWEDKLASTMPAPGAYSPGEHKVHRTSVGAKTSAKRFSEESTATSMPGPGQYNVTKSGLMKPTFNVALNRRPEKFRMKSSSVSPPRRIRTDTGPQVPLSARDTNFTATAPMEALE